MKVLVVAAAMLMSAAAQAQAVLDLSALGTAPRPAALEGCIAARGALDRALVEDPKRSMTDFFAPEARIHVPRNTVVDRAEIVARHAADDMRYSRFVRRIEHASLRATGECLLMGAEETDATGADALAGTRALRRFTDIWRPDGARWLLTVRQATNVTVRPLP
jgi:hypothetical protein